jgi:hypothetical protein
MRKHIALGTVIALGVGAQAMAAESLSYSYVEGAFVQGDMGSIDGAEGDITADGDGILASGSAAFGERFFAFASFGSLNLNDIEVDGDAVEGKVKVKPLTVGLGFHMPVGASVDFVTGVSYERIKFSVSDGEVSISDSDDGYGVSAGLRGLIGERLELSGNLKYLDLGSSELVYSVGGRFHFTDMVSAGLDYSKYDDSDLTIWGANVRYSF